MPRLALGLEYDGRPFQGWQSQPSRQTVQDVLEAAIARFTGRQERIAVIAAGRTDAGVHALGQVIHLDTDALRSMHAWVRGLDALLPPTIAVRWAREVPETFHARFSALRRSYVYRIFNDPIRSALLDGRAAWCFRPLDLNAMREAAGTLLGEHDFSSFRSVQCQAKSPVKRLERLDIRREGANIEFVFTANAFLHHMVRNIVGSLVYVGLGRRPAAWMSEVLAARDRTRAAPTYAACGLYFATAEYPPEFGLPRVPVAHVLGADMDAFLRGGSV